MARAGPRLDHAARAAESEDPATGQLAARAEFAPRRTACAPRPPKRLRFDAQSPGAVAAKGARPPHDTAPPNGESTMPQTPDNELVRVHDWWRAANYLTVGQIYLLGNPLLTEPLRPQHIKPRLLGHWGTSPGLSLVYAHLNRVIQQRDVDVLFLAGPGHGGPAIVANVWLEGTYQEIYPHVTRDGAGMLRLFRQFSTPGGIPSHVGPQTPGSIHEGGELGYVLAHAFGAAFDDPKLVSVAVVGDGEAETAPLEGTWKGIRFLNPRRDGAVLPILHLNGYKISGPTVLGRASKDSVRSLLRGHGYEPIFVEGSEPMEVHGALAAALDCSFDRIAEIQASSRVFKESTAPSWPAIVLRTPKGWTGPKVVNGLPVEGTFRAHQVPLGEVRSDARQLAMLEEWMLSYGPRRSLRRRRRAARSRPRGGPRGREAHGRQPGRQRHGARDRSAGAGLLALRARCPESRLRAAGVHARARRDAARSLRGKPDDVPPRLPRRDQLEPSRRGVRGRGSLLRRRGPPRRRPRVAEGTRHGGVERAQLPGLARGLRADRPARPLRDVRGVRPRHCVDGDPARQVARDERGPSLARPGPVAELPPDVDVLAQRPQRLQPPGPRLHGYDPLEKRDRGPRLSAARRQLPAERGRPLLPEPQLHQPRHHRQAAAAPVARYRSGDDALRARRLRLVVGRNGDRRRPA